MKNDFMKPIIVAIISVGSLAKTCVKTATRTAELSEPLIAETRFMKKAGKAEHEAFTMTEAVKYTKNTVEITRIVNEINKKDSLKKVKPMVAIPKK